MLGIPVPDLIVIAVYSVLVLAIGWAAMFRVRNQEDFFLGGRRFGKALQIFGAFGQATSSESAVGTVTTTYRDGAGGIWSHLMLLWATPLYWIAAPWYRRMRVLTLGDFFAERYQSRLMGMFYSVIASFVMVISIGLGLKAVTVTLMGVTLKSPSALTAEEQAERQKALRLEALSNRRAQGQLSTAEMEELHGLQNQRPRREFCYLSQSWVVGIVAGIVIIYGVVGGLGAAVWADVLQGALILLLSVMLIPFGIAKLNHMHGVSGLAATARVLHEELPGRFFSVFGSTQNVNFTWYFVAILAIMSVLNVAVQSNQLTANASARDELAARVGFTVGMFLKRICIVLWGIAGLLTYALYGSEIQNSDLVWGHATRDLLGGAGAGLVGLAIVCLLSAFQSTAATMMLSGAGLFTRNVYAPLFPDRSEAHYVRVGRVAGVLILVTSGLLCAAFNSVLEMLKFYWEFSAILAAAFWCGLKWRRATRAGGWASMLMAFMLFLAVPIGLPMAVPEMRTQARYLARTREHTITQSYRASKRDLEDRQREILAWQGPGSPPLPLQPGEPVQRAVAVPSQAIYWAQGIREVAGHERGEGMFYPEMWLLGQLMDLSANPPALNETIRYAYKILLPFLVLIIVSLCTGPDKSPALQRLFLRLRTKVLADRHLDDLAVQTAYAIPESTRRDLLFPNTALEFFKWDKEDVLGFLAACLVAAAIMAWLYLMLRFGG